MQILGTEQSPGIVLHSRRLLRVLGLRWMLIIFLDEYYRALLVRVCRLLRMCLQEQPVDIPTLSLYGRAISKEDNDRNG